MVEHRRALGLAACTPEAGLTEAEDPAVTDAVRLAPLRRYVDAVNEGTQAWIAKLSTMALDTVPEASWRLTNKAGIPADGDARRGCTRCGPASR